MLRVDRDGPLVDGGRRLGQLRDPGPEIHVASRLTAAGRPAPPPPPAPLLAFVLALSLGPPPIGVRAPPALVDGYPGCSAPVERGGVMHEVPASARDAVIRFQGPPQPSQEQMPFSVRYSTQSA